MESAIFLLIPAHRFCAKLAELPLPDPDGPASPSVEPIPSETIVAIGPIPRLPAVTFPRICPATVAAGPVALEIRFAALCNVLYVELDAAGAAAGITSGASGPPSASNHSIE